MVNHYRDMWPHGLHILAPLKTGAPKKGKPVAYYSKKLNSAQINYVTIDEELLCVIATQPEFHAMLLGAELHVHTDQKIFEITLCLSWNCQHFGYLQKVNFEDMSM
jgi:hypothetical protein